MDDGVVDREYPYRARAPLLVLFIICGCAFASLYWAVTDHGPFRGGDGRVTVGETLALAFRWSDFGLCCTLAILASRQLWIDLMHCRRIALTSIGIFVSRDQWCWFPVEVFLEYKKHKQLRRDGCKTYRVQRCRGNPVLLFLLQAQIFDQSGLSC